MPTGRPRAFSPLQIRAREIKRAARVLADTRTGGEARRSGRARDGQRCRDGGGGGGAGCGCGFGGEGVVDGGGGGGEAGGGAEGLELVLLDADHLEEAVLRVVTLAFVPSYHSFTFSPSKPNQRHNINNDWNGILTTCASCSFSNS